MYMGFSRGLSSEPRKCGGCNSVLIGQGHGDMWVGNSGFVPLCLHCIEAIFAILPNIRDTLRKANKSYQRSVWDDEEEEKNKNKKFVLTPRPDK